jgi:hypothetical protein
MARESHKLLRTRDLDQTRAREILESEIPDPMRTRSAIVAEAASLALTSECANKDGVASDKKVYILFV